MQAAADMTLDELRAALAPLLAGEAAFDGWSDAALTAAARGLGIPPSRAMLAFPEGPVEMIDAWFASIDQAMIEALPAETLAAMRVRERITALVAKRLALVAPYREALRRALAILAMPNNLATGARLGWRAADAMWRLAGDDATGFAHYSKRATLAAVYGATLLVLLDDSSEGHADSLAFLDRRIDAVMRFEKFKARLKPDGDRHFNVARFLGRLRYPTH
jgi:ubiquinone biosynthesis protein COQ9